MMTPEHENSAGLIRDSVRFRAVSVGVAEVLRHLLDSMSSSQDFLSEELEDRPAAQRYLEENSKSQEAGRKWIDFYLNNAASLEDCDIFDPGLMMEAVVARCNRLLPGRVGAHWQTKDAEVVIGGSLIELQEIMLRAMQTLAGSLGNESILASTEIREYTADDLASMESQCPAGAYFSVYIGAMASDADKTYPLPFWKQFLQEEGLAPESMESVWLHFAGLMRIHMGELFWVYEPGGRRCGATAIFPIIGSSEMRRVSNLDDANLQGRGTILLVDDEDMIWDVIADMLQRLGYTLVLAGNGLEAVEVYENNPGKIDLVILDMIMPEMDGHKAFFRLKEIDPKVKVLLSSGYVSEENVRSVIDAGAAGFLKKPYRMVDLAKKLREILG
jgi:CheY-like chemotaxis protein